MTIHYDEVTQTFHLRSRSSSYIMQLVKSKYLAHVHWGGRVRGTNTGQLLATRRRCSFSPSTDSDDLTLSLDTLPQELPGFGGSDFRSPAYQVQLENGTTVSELVYESHRIYSGKSALPGLPSTYAVEESESESLEIVLSDSVIGLKAILSYTVFHELDAVTRSVRYVNESGNNIKLLRALSMGIDFPHDDFDMLHLSGSWARERHIERRPLASGGSIIESRRGSSSHSLNPFLALLSKDADEDRGEAYGFSLVYSGSFTAQVEVDPYYTTRVVMGINPFDFSWLLEPGQTFQTPEAVLVYSSEGIGGMSRTYHRLYRTRLCRGSYRDRSRPVLLNNWEATYFEFNADKIEGIARAGQELGAELFVLDDGWFGKRDNDKSSLGDWFVDQRKLPDGLPDLVERVRKLGMQFGLWFEPEMISPDSELYRDHPDWCLHVPNYRRTEARQQLVLDYSRQDVRDYIVEAVTHILRSCPITYLKWDMNRNMTEIGSALLPPERQRETAHRYILGLYEVLERLTSAFPYVLFESCSGGGGRFDPGMLYYMPQTWTSDNTDAVERLKIQYGTSIVYPISSMGAHVSAVPNHQVHRTTPIEMRGHVAMSGNFGYELDPALLTEEEKRAVKQQIALYKDMRFLIQSGEFYRLLSPFEGNETAWMFVMEDQSEALVAYFQVLSEPNAPLKRLRLKGLNLNSDYFVFDADRPEDGEELFGGDELMRVGLKLPVWKGDFRSKLYRLRRKGDVPMNLMNNNAAKSEFFNRVLELPVFDTHTHLVGDRLCAGGFWEIAHYFWLFRELQAGGYPANAESLPEEERIVAFLAAYRATRSTLMNWTFTSILKELYGIELRDAASIREADAAIKRSHLEEGWAQQVADRLNIRRFVVNHPQHAEFHGMRENAVLLPRIDGAMGPWVNRVIASLDPAKEFLIVKNEIDALLDGYGASGLPGIMMTLPRYESSANIRKEIGVESTSDDVMMELLHVVCTAAERNDLLVQLFLGVERSWCGTAVPANDTERILKLSGLFEKYSCEFELVLASELNNMDAVQAAWNFPNVHVGGMWWFNFRASTYKDSMQCRLEALPAGKSSVIVSDARCMEWSFGKILLVKKLAAEFLWERLESGWIDRETALYTAEQWLYESAAKRYLMKK